MDRQVCAVILLFLAQAQPVHALDHAVHQQAAGQRDQHAKGGADQLADQADTAQATQCRLAEDAAGNAAPHPTQTMQRPHAQHVVDLPAILGGDKEPYKQTTGDGPCDQCAHRVHQVGTRTNGHQPGQWAVMQEARVVAADDQGRDGAANHGHQRVDRHQATDAIQRLRTHHVEAKPADNQDPRPQRQERNARRRERHQAPFTVAPVARAKQQHRRQRQPAAHGVDHHGAGEIMEAGAKGRKQPGLQAEIAVPHHALKKRVDKRHDQSGRAKLRRKPCPLGNAPGNDRRDRRRKGQQEEELHQAVAMVGADHRRRLHEAHPVGDPIAYKEIGQCGDGEVAEDLRQGVDLVLLAHRADFEEREAGVHGQDHDRADQDKQGIGAVDQGVHRTLHIFHGGWQACSKGKKHQNGSCLGCAHYIGTTGPTPLQRA
ncbi:hypothetical protein ALQ17_05320 [Pseudomonas fluorescens]|nr:hypothetical protein ALQ17_05320 [Pseudomonas fluorescens]